MIRDITSRTVLLRRRRPIHRLDPRVKIVCTLIFWFLYLCRTVCLDMHWHLYFLRA